MKKLTLDETWRLCVDGMWKWIAKQKKQGSKKKPWELKEHWAIKHGYKNNMVHNCFFCDWAAKRYGILIENGYGDYECPKCPGVKIDPKFHCESRKSYKWNDHPTAFYNKLQSLNRKRLAKK